MTDFKPNWVSKPGSTMKDIMQEKGMSLWKFASEMNISETEAKKLLDAEIKITKRTAAQLSQVLGASSEFWVNRERHYRNELKRLNK
jgi:HTH-type transcriptional regulator / antitoxin HigA